MDLWASETISGLKHVSIISVLRSFIKFLGTLLQLRESVTLLLIVFAFNVIFGETLEFS